MKLSIVFAFLYLCHCAFSQDVMHEKVDLCNRTLDFESRNGRLYANGAPFELKGTNWFGYETETFGPHGCWTFSSMSECFKYIFNFLRSNNFNALRVPVAVDVVYNNYAAGSFPYNGIKTLDSLSIFIDEAANYGILIMLDIHRVNHKEGISELWYSGEWSTDKVKSAIEILINRFKSRWNVFALDIKNEPHGSASWGSNDRSTDWRLAAEDFANFVYQRVPGWLVFVEGVERNVQGQSTSYNCYWGENLMGVRNNPVRVPNANKLVYSPHAYGPSVFRQPYHPPNAPNYPYNLDAVWEEHFGFIPSLTGRAVVLGEWGGRNTGDDIDYHERLSVYLKSKGMQSNFYWCLNPNSGDTGGLLEDDWRTPVQSKLSLLSRTVTNPTKVC